MKVEQDKEYRPITITLETQEEAKLFNELLLHCSTKRQGELRAFGAKLFNLLYNDAEF